MALGALRDIVTFTPSAGCPGAGVMQTGVVIGVTASANRVAYNLGQHGDVLRFAHECSVASVTVLGNQTRH